MACSISNGSTDTSGKIVGQIDRDAMADSRRARRLAAASTSPDQIDYFRFDAQGVRFETRHIEKVADKTVEAFGFLADGGKQFVV